MDVWSNLICLPLGAVDQPGPKAHFIFSVYDSYSISSCGDFFLFCNMVLHQLFQSLSCPECIVYQFLWLKPRTRSWALGSLPGLAHNPVSNHPLSASILLCVKWGGWCTFHRDVVRLVLLCMKCFEIWQRKHKVSVLNSGNITHGLYGPCLLLLWWNQKLYDFKFQREKQQELFHSMLRCYVY